MWVRAALLALACAAWGGAVSEHTDAAEHGDRGESRQKRQTLINPGAGAPGCADWSLLNYLLYYYLIQAQTTEGAQIQHQQTDQMAAALLRLRRVRGTDPLPTLLSQPAGQAAILTLLQKVTNGDTAQLLLLLNDIRDQGRAPPAVAGPLGQPLGQPLGPLDQRRGVFGAGAGQRLSAQGQQFAAAIAAQQLAGQFDPLAGAGQPGLTGRKASALAGEFGLNGIGADVSELQGEPQAQAQVSQTAGGLQELLSVTKPPPTSVPAPPPAPATPAPPPPPPPTEVPPKTTKRPTTAPPKRPAAPPAERPRPATVRSSVLAPSTSLHVTTSTLVTTILLRKTKTVPAVRGDTPTSVEHVHTVTHVLTATGLQTKTIIVTPTLVISGTTTRTVFNGVPAEAATGRRRRRRRSAQPVSAAPLQASASAHIRKGSAEGSGVRTPQLPLLASAEA